MVATEGRYDAEHRVTVAEVPGLRVRMLSLGTGQSVPWHYHSAITDTFFCLAGRVRVTTRDPHAVHVLEPGETCAVGSGTAHLVTGDDDAPCRFLVVQGVGEYDFVPVDD